MFIAAVLWFAPSVTLGGSGPSAGAARLIQRHLRAVIPIPAAADCRRRRYEYTTSTVALPSRSRTYSIHTAITDSFYHFYFLILSLDYLN